MPVTGPVTLKVIPQGGSPSGYLGAKVACNDQDGNLLHEGTTDAAGTYVCEDMPENGSVTFDASSTGFGNAAYTTFNVQPGHTYPVVVPSYATAPTGPQDFTLHVTVTGPLPTVLINGTSYTGGWTEIQLGKGCGDSNYTSASGQSFDIHVRRDCVLSDGTFTLYAYQNNANNDFYAYQVIPTLTAPMGGGTLPVTLGGSNWKYSYDSAVTLNFTNAPSDLLTSGSMVISTTAGFGPQNRGQGFNLREVTQGAVSGSAYLGTVARYPSNLAAPMNGTGYFTSFGAEFLDGGDLTIGLFSEQKDVIGSLVTDDLRDYFPRADMTSTLYLGGARPVVEWRMPSQGSYSAVATIITWPDPANSGSQLQWFGANASNAGMMRVPTLPASMSRYNPPTSGVIQDTTMALSASWYSTYAQVAEHEGVINLIASVGGSATLGFLDGQQASATVKALVAPASVSASSAAQAAPAQWDLGHASPLVRRMLSLKPAPLPAPLLK
jgi:hypothetical protein